VAGHTECTGEKRNVDVFLRKREGYHLEEIDMDERII
jgi:hypothetical protein